MAKTKKVAKPVVLKAENGAGKRASSESAAGPKSKKKKAEKKVVPPPKIIEEEEDSDVEEEEVVPVKNGKPADEDDDSADEDMESEEDEKPVKKAVKSNAKPASKFEDEDDSDDDDADEDEDVKIKTPKKPQASGVGGGTKTIFVKNIAWSVDEDIISEFFKDVGEITDVRLAKDENGRSKGYGHIEFVSEEEAQQAVLKNGETLEGRDLFIDLAKERGAAGPNAGTPRTGSGKTAFIKGFDRNDDEDNIRSSLTEFFSECGDINTVRIPTDRESGQIKGFAYIEFTTKESLSKALALNGADYAGQSLVVDEASEPGGGGGRGRGGFGGGRGGDRGGGRFGGRGGGRGNDRGRGGRGGRGSFGGRGGGRGGRGGRGGSTGVLSKSTS
ncbi:unnamed protein product [Sphagnum jensenii]|uniref:RRM domain-containing protein n=1 Tax=Sphagnum jensenii TaxID=128206 RepID=A0ABP1A5W4_9BRYO